MNSRFVFKGLQIYFLDPLVKFFFAPDHVGLDQPNFFLEAVFKIFAAVNGGIERLEVMFQIIDIALDAFESLDVVILSIFHLIFYFLYVFVN